MRFRTKVLQSGKTATGIEVPAKLVAALGSSKRPPVEVKAADVRARSIAKTIEQLRDGPT
jgi:K+-transporting ATPase c subunit